MFFASITAKARPILFTMASTTLRSDMTKFLTAMHHVYKFPTPSTTSTSLQWTPPPASAGHKGRYLWTDAFGVLNFLTLFKETSDPYFLSLSKTLVSAVHDTLGRTRDGRSRLPNATDSAPLAGGLRIGKEEESGPDGDGQYHHYLTLWMFALNRLSLASNQKEYNDLAIQLAKAIHPRFVYDRDSARPRMYWKMNMDLTHPLVRSEGHLDPIDGLVMFRLLQQTDGLASRVLEKEIEEYDRIVRLKWENYESRDPLDLGMTMWTAHFFGIGDEKERWSEHLLNAAKRDTERLFDVGYFEQSTKRRLAFREFGTVLGMRTGADGEEWENRVKKVIGSWEKTGLVPDPSEEKGAAGRNAEIDLLPITLVMFAAALNPRAFKKGS
jgi:hypothetical protein